MILTDGRVSIFHGDEIGRASIKNCRAPSCAKLVPSNVNFYKNQLAFGCPRFDHICSIKIFVCPLFEEGRYQLFKLSFGGNFFSNGGETKILIGQTWSNRGQTNAVWFKNSQVGGDGVNFIQLVHRASRIENADKRGKLSIDRDSGWTRIKHAATRSFDAEICQY